MADTRVRLGEIELKNPVIPASGTFGYGREFAELFDLNILGGIAVKGTTIEAKRKPQNSRGCRRHDKLCGTSESGRG